MASPAAATGRFNSKSPSIKRIMQESRELAQCPDPTLTAAPLESNLFEWHFTLTGPPASSYTGGIYHGRIVLPPSYPLRPPSFRFLTPSGRFETNREICLSISGHHEETWQPAWGIRTALCAIRAFMAGDAKGQVGGLDMHPQAREKLAKESRTWRCTTCGGRSNEEIIAECEAQWREAHPAQDTNAADADQTVPEELRLAFREDLDKDKDKSATAATAVRGKEGEAKDGSTHSRGFSRDISGQENPPARTPPPSIGAGARVTPAAAASGRTSPSTIATATTTNIAKPSTVTQTPVRSQTQTPQRQSAGAGTGTGTGAGTSSTLRPALPPIDSPPAWIDKAIIGLALTLLVMLIKRMAGSAD